MSKHPVLPVTLLLGAVLAAACGSPSQPAGETPAAPTPTASTAPAPGVHDGRKVEVIANDAKVTLKNGEHFADYIRRVDVPGSKFAFDLGGRQMRYLAIEPRRDAIIREIELVKGPDRTAPVVMAATVETR